MNNKIVNVLMLAGIVFLITIICIFSFEKQNNNMGELEPVDFNFNSAELQYLKNNEEVKIYVDSELKYLAGNGSEGYLEDYLSEVLKPVGLEPELVTDEADKKKADCNLVIVTDKIRNNDSGKNYTTPLFQMEGAMFIKEDAKYDGVIMSDRLSPKKCDRIKFRAHHLTYTEASSSEELVAQALKQDSDFIIGDRSSIMHLLGNGGKYIPFEKSLYSCNVCIMTDSSDDVMYQILNQAIHEVDRHKLSYYCSRKWFDGNGPVYMRDGYEDVYQPIIIILAAVFIAFFIYYLTNRNMYRELNERMKLLIASKRELKTTFNGVRYFMAEINLEGDITDINRTFDEYSNGNAMHKKIWDVISPDGVGRDTIIKKVSDAKSGAESEGIEVKLGRKLFVIDIFPIEDVRGTIEKMLFMAIDVTDERMAKQQLLQNNKMIAIGQLAAGVAHEIRNPLGIIRNYCYVLKNIDDEQLRAKAVEQIENAVDASGTIINNLLDFSRISTGHYSLINVEEHVKSILELNKSALRGKNIECNVICRERIETYIASEVFDMVLINLISNASDAMGDSGSITITLKKITTYKEKEDTFSMRVTDTGEGIDENIVEEIFNPFFTTKGNNGTGLGLYIVYNEVKKMNGEIEVESTLGEGSTFVVTLPLREKPENGENNNERRES